MARPQAADLPRFEAYPDGRGGRRMKIARPSSRSLGFRSFGSFGSRPILKTAACGICRKSKTGRIHNYTFRREMEEK
jgi:hypothetical protein